MCQTIDSDMLVDYVFTKHVSINNVQLSKIQKKLFEEIKAPILVDISLRGFQNVLSENPERFKIIQGPNTFSLERIEPPYEEQFLDDCYAPFFPKHDYPVIKKILLETV